MSLGVPAPPRKQPNSLLARGGVYVLGMGKNIFKKLCFLFLSDSRTIKPETYSQWLTLYVNIKVTGSQWVNMIGQEKE